MPLNIRRGHGNQLGARADRCRSAGHRAAPAAPAAGPRANRFSV